MCIYTIVDVEHTTKTCIYAYMHMCMYVCMYVPYARKSIADARICAYARIYA